MRIRLEGLDQARRDIERIGRDFPTVLAQGLNRTAEAMYREAERALDQHIDRPTPYTARGIKLFKARADRLDAELFIQPDQAKYLKYAIEGGRIPTNLTPTRATRLNQYGNVPGMQRGMEGIKGRAQTKFIGEINGILGVWQRYGRGGTKLKLLVKVERDAPRTARLPWYETAERVASRRLQRDIGVAIGRALQAGRV